MAYLDRLKALESQTHLHEGPPKPTKPPFAGFEGSPGRCDCEKPTSLADFEERAAMVQEAAGVPREWAEGFATLEAHPAPRGVDAAAWLAMLNAAGRFLDEWGAKAAALGWTAGELFALDPDSPMGRLDRRGAGFFLMRSQVVAITATEIAVKTGEAIQRIRRRSGLGAPAWENAPGE